MSRILSAQSKQVQGVKHRTPYLDGPIFSAFSRRKPLHGVNSDAVVLKQDIAHAGNQDPRSPFGLYPWFFQQRIHFGFLLTFHPDLPLPGDDLDRRLFIGSGDMDRAGKTGVEGMNDPQDLHRLFQVFDRRVHQGLFDGTHLAGIVSG